ncbi:MAG: hypothetical protein ACE5E9_02220 [Nitrospinaceae bacterium]
MTSYWGSSNDLFDEGYKALRGGILLIGVSLTLLGVLIFLFPNLMAFIFASFFLFVGVSALVLGYKIWKLKNQVRPFEWSEGWNADTMNGGTAGYSRKTITFIMR